jgi:apolipoprotein N-acyltransferase
MNTRKTIIALEALIILSLLISFLNLALGRELMVIVQLFLLLSFFYLLLVKLRNTVKKGVNYYLLLFTAVYLIAQVPWLTNALGLGMEARILVISTAFGIIAFLAVMSKTIWRKKLSLFERK